MLCIIQEMQSDEWGDRRESGSISNIPTAQYRSSKRNVSISGFELEFSSNKTYQVICDVCLCLFA